MSVLSVLEDDGLPSSPSEARVDSFGLDSNLSLELGITLDSAAGGCTDLNECELSLVLGKSLEE